MPSCSRAVRHAAINVVRRLNCSAKLNGLPHATLVRSQALFAIARAAPSRVPSPLMRLPRPAACAIS